jgi:hypothetical protein
VIKKGAKVQSIAQRKRDLLTIYENGLKQRKEMKQNPFNENDYIYNSDNQAALPSLIGEIQVSPIDLPITLMPFQHIISHKVFYY